MLDTRIILSGLGSVLHAIIALLVAGFFGAFSYTVVFVLISPMIGIGVRYWFGRPQPRKLAVLLVIGLPVLILIASGSGPCLDRVGSSHGGWHCHVVRLRPDGN